MIYTDDDIAERIAHSATLEDAKAVLYRFQDRLTFDLLHQAADLERNLWSKPRISLIRMLEAKARKVSHRVAPVGKRHEDHELA